LVVWFGKMDPAIHNCITAPELVTWKVILIRNFMSLCLHNRCSLPGYESKSGDHDYSIGSIHFSNDLDLENYIISFGNNLNYSNYWFISRKFIISNFFEFPFTPCNSEFFNQIQ
jgi:hypothetical protein